MTFDGLRIRVQFFARQTGHFLLFRDLKADFHSKPDDFFIRVGIQPALKSNLIGIILRLRGVRSNVHPATRHLNHWKESARYDNGLPVWQAWRRGPIWYKQRTIARRPINRIAIVPHFNSCVHSAFMLSSSSKHILGFAKIRRYEWRERFY